MKGDGSLGRTVSKGTQPCSPPALRCSTAGLSRSQANTLGLLSPHGRRSLPVPALGTRRQVPNVLCLTPAGQVPPHAVPGHPLRPAGAVRALVERLLATARPMAAALGRGCAGGGGVNPAGPGRGPERWCRQLRSAAQLAREPPFSSSLAASAVAAAGGAGRVGARAPPPCSSPPSHRWLGKGVPRRLVPPVRRGG